MMELSVQEDKLELGANFVCRGNSIVGSLGLEEELNEHVSKRS